MRKLKHHENKLLKRVNFLQWKSENHKEHGVVRRYHLHDREDYVKYSKICGYITKLASRISHLDSEDPFRRKITSMILDKLYDAGIISHKASLAQLSQVNASSFCKRRLASILVALKMSQHLQEASDLIQQGHIRIGPEVIKDPAFFVTRSMEDLVTWVDQSKIRRKIATYYGSVDDYEF